MKSIQLRHVNQGNLKDISIEIPKEKLIVLTGVSGSGKSTLAMDVIFQECQRQYLEAMGMQGIQKPNIEYLKNASPAICISQNEIRKNPRSSVGTLTNIYTDLRMIFEKLGVRVCPHCHQLMSCVVGKEEVVKDGVDFIVYQYCEHCGAKLEKFTRTYFSYNTQEGACPTCHGLGYVACIQDKVAFHEEASLEEGAVDIWDYKYKDFMIASFYKALALCNMNIEPSIKLQDFTDEQRHLLYYGVEDELSKRFFKGAPIPKTVSAGRFEGVYPYMWKKYTNKESNTTIYDKYFEKKECPDCQGERLQEAVRRITVYGKRLPEIAILSLEEVLIWINALEQAMSEVEHLLSDVYLLDIKTKLQRLLNVGLGYLSLDRQTSTLSGGEAQRMKLASVLDSQLSGIIYLLDEPTIGLHPKDTQGILTILEALRDLGNSVLVIEHDEEIMRAADMIIDIGPGSGKHGGTIVGQGTLVELQTQESSITGKYFKHKGISKRKITRDKQGEIIIHNASLHNLQHLDVRIPLGQFVGICGVSGSGKSTLIFDVLAKSSQQGKENVVYGLEQVQEIICVDQNPVVRMKRSNVATYCDVFTPIRKVFSGLEKAKELNYQLKDFSFNVKGGRCEVCEGLGYQMSNLLFFEDRKIPCPVCKGKQYQKAILQVKYQSYSIYDILCLSIEEAYEVFQEETTITTILKRLLDVGLGYLTLSQSLTTLSQGEAQRLKLAKDLLQKKHHHTLYLLDEPSVGLHPCDIENFMKVLDGLVDNGNTVIIVEHNTQMLKCCDYLIELGEGGGIHGGHLISEGSVDDMKASPTSITKEYL